MLKPRPVSPHMTWRQKHYLRMETSSERTRQIPRNKRAVPGILIDHLSSRKKLLPHIELSVAFWKRGGTLYIWRNYEILCFFLSLHINTWNDCCPQKWIRWGRNMRLSEDTCWQHQGGKACWSFTFLSCSSTKCSPTCTSHDPTNHPQDTQVVVKVGSATNFKVFQYLLI